MAADYVKTRDEYEAQGAKYIGSLGMAAKAGYYTPAACERLGCPVSEQELESIKHFAMYASCYTDQCIERDGRSYRPCLPVFYREAQ